VLDDLFEALAHDLLRGGFTRVEQTPLEGGHGDDVIRQRMAFRGPADRPTYDAAK
jgi:hypothetical protein